MSRLLWPLYLFFVTWIVLPVYATIIAGLLPLSDADIDRFLMVVIVSTGVLAWWSGFRGGPLLMSEAQVLLGSGQSGVPVRISVLRQALFVGGFFGLGAAWLTAMAAGGAIDWVVSAQRTLVGVAIGVIVVSLAVLWNVDGAPWRDRTAAVLLTALMVTSAIVAPSVESLVGPLGLLAVLAASWAAVRAPDIRLDRLWARSLVLAELQYGAALLDFRSALASLRSSRDGPRVQRERPGTQHLPAWLWRPLRSLTGSPSLVIVRVVATIGAVALFLVVLEDTAARLAAVAGVLVIGAADLTTPLSAVARRPLLFRSTRIPSRVTLLAEAGVGIGLTLVAGLLGWVIVARIPGEAHAPEVMAVAFAAGGTSAMQARLGGPDLGAMINRYGAQRVQSTLALRAGGPILALLLTVSGVIYLTKQWAPGLAMVLAAGWAIALSLMTRPETDL